MPCISNGAKSSIKLLKKGAQRTCKSTAHACFSVNACPVRSRGLELEIPHSEFDTALWNWEIPHSGIQSAPSTHHKAPTSCPANGCLDVSDSERSRLTSLTL